MADTPKDYRNTFLFLSEYVDLKIQKSKTKFTPQEKAKISKTAKALQFAGYIFYDEVEKKYYPLVKFVKSGKKQRVSGIRNLLEGRFIAGAKPNDKMRGNTITRENHDKIFIPLDFSFIEEYNEDGEIYSESEVSDFVFEYLFDGDIPNQILKSDYFSIVSANGWEIGRGNYKRSYEKPATLEKKLKIFNRKQDYVVKSAEGQLGRTKKLRSVSRDIAEIIVRIFNRTNDRYKVGLETISGIYLYSFKKQRQPTKSEKEKLKRKKGKKK